MFGIITVSKIARFKNLTLNHVKYVLFLASDKPTEPC